MHYLPNIQRNAAGSAEKPPGSIPDRQNEALFALHGGS